MSTKLFWRQDLAQSTHCCMSELVCRSSRHDVLMLPGPDYTLYLHFTSSKPQTGTKLSGAYSADRAACQVGKATRRLVSGQAGQVKLISLIPGSSYRQSSRPS